MGSRISPPLQSQDNDSFSAYNHSRTQSIDTNPQVNTGKKLKKPNKSLKKRLIFKNKVFMALTLVSVAILTLGASFLCAGIPIVGGAILGISIAFIISVRALYSRNEHLLKHKLQKQQKLEMQTQQDFVNATIQDIITTDTTQKTHPFNTENQCEKTEIKNQQNAYPAVIKSDLQKIDEKIIMNNDTFMKYHFKRNLSELINKADHDVFIKNDPTNPQTIQINTTKNALNDLNKIEHRLYIESNIYYDTRLGEDDPSFSENIIPLANVIIDGDLKQGSINWLKSLPDMQSDTKRYIILNKPCDIIEQCNKELKDKAIIIQKTDLLPEEEKSMTFEQLMLAFHVLNTNKNTKCEFDMNHLKPKNKQVFLHFIQEIYKQHRHFAVTSNMFSSKADGVFTLCNFMAQNKENTTKILSHLNKIKHENMEGQDYIKLLKNLVNITK